MESWCLLVVVAWFSSIQSSDAHLGELNPWVVRFSKEEAEPCRPSTVIATCNLAPDPTAPFQVTGKVDLAQTNYCKLIGRLKIKLRVKGFPANNTKRLRGFHVHQFGDLSDGCTSTGGHYNPFNRTHGAPWDRIRHVGDFGNVPVRNDGRVDFDLKIERASLFGEYSILGRAFVVHAGQDDLGRGGDAESKKTGNAGGRLACCVIGRRA